MAKKLWERVLEDIDKNREASEQNRVNANNQFNEYVKQDGAFDTNRHTYHMNDLLDAYKSTSKEQYNNFRRANGITLWDTVKQTANDLGRVTENLWLGGKSGFTQSFNYTYKSGRNHLKSEDMQNAENVVNSSELNDREKAFFLNLQKNSNNSKEEEQNKALEIASQKSNNMQEMMNPNKKQDIYLPISKRNDTILPKSEAIETERVDTEKIKKVSEMSGFDKIIEKDSEKIAENVSNQSNAITKKLAELTPSVGNMAVGGAVSTINPGVGTAYFTLSAAGSYYDDAKQRGMTNKQAENYAGIMGLMEGATEEISFGNFSKAGKTAKALITGTGKEVAKEGIEEIGKASIKKALKEYGVGIADNVMQEALIEPIQETVASSVGGKDKADWENIGQRMLQSGIDGGLVAVITGGAEIGISSCIGIVEKSRNGKTITQEELKSAVKDASGKIDAEKKIIDSVQQQVNKYKNYNANKPLDSVSQEWLNRANNIINENNSNLQQNNINNQINPLIQQVTNQENEMAQNGNMEQIQNTEQNINYNNSNYYRTANKYNFDTNNETIKGIYDVTSKRGVNVDWDDTAFINSKQNAKWTVDSEGNRSVVLNPHADTDTALQSIMVHELTHDIEGTKEYEKISSMILERLKSSNDYDSMMLDVANAYQNEYKNMSKEQFSRMIEQEAVADYLGENLGNQEFVNDLVRSTDKTQVQKIIDWVKNKITSLKNVVTGNKELNYWNKIKENFERAYNQEYQGNNLSERFSIQTNNNGNQYVRVDTDQNIFEGIDKKDYNKIAKMYMQDYLKGKTVLAGNDNADIGRKGINKYTNPQQDTRFFDEKMQLTPELKNVLEIAEKVSTGNPTKETTKFPNWEYYKFNFELGGESFEGLINIGIDKEGNKHFYEINKIHNTRNIECFIETKKYYG